MKNKKGITLIALIITIIVMLILAVVSIKVALDSGLFSKAQTAQNKTETEIAIDTAQDIVMRNYDVVNGIIERRKYKRPIKRRNIRRKRSNRIRAMDSRNE